MTDDATSTASVALELTDRISPAERDAITSGLLGYNEEQVGPTTARAIGVLVRDAEGRACGGLIGRTVHTWLVIELLFLPGRLRLDGLGGRVLREAESEAVRRGCRFARLDTASFQARGFYEKQGYSVFATLDLERDGHQLHFMRKTLTGPGA